ARQRVGDGRIDFAGFPRRDRRAERGLRARPLSARQVALPARPRLRRARLDAEATRTFKMRWRKRGLVYVPAGESWWTKNRYAFNPTVEVLADDLLRVYFAALDDKRYGRIGYVELDARDPQRILNETQEP